MRRTVVAAAFAAVVAVAWAPRPALAIDLTGSWREVRNAPCTNVSQGEKKITKDADTNFSSLGITQSGSALALTIINAPTIGLVGWVQADAKDKAVRGMMHQCSTTFFTGYQILSARTFPANAEGVSGRLVVEFIWAGTTSAETCKIIFERYDAADPGGIGCP